MPGTARIFVDESGDLGFSTKSTRTFVIGYVHIEKHHRVSCDVKKFATHLSRAKLQIREFKFHEDREDVRRRFLNLIAKSEVIKMGAQKTPNFSWGMNGL